MNQYEIELRDKIAFARMQKILDSGDPNTECDSELVAMCSYDFADALMAERQKHLDDIELVKNSITYSDVKVAKLKAECEESDAAANVRTPYFLKEGGE